MSNPKRRECAGCGNEHYPRDVIPCDHKSWCPRCADARAAQLETEAARAGRAAVRMRTAIAEWVGL